MSYSTKDLRDLFIKEGIEVAPIDRKDSTCNLFPEDLDFGTKSDGEEKAVELFLSFYRNKNYSCFYIDPSFDIEDRVEELCKVVELYETPLCLETETFSYKILVGYYSSSFLFRYTNEIGTETVGILFPNLVKVGEK